MYRMIKNIDIFDGYEPIEAMSTINPKYCNKNNIQIEIEQRDEGPIPHLHVYHDATRDKRRCSYVRLDKVAYSDHHKDGSMKMPKNVKEKFVGAMNSIWPKHYHQDSQGNLHLATGYEAAVDIWVDTYEDDYGKFPLDSDGNLIQLDYSKL